MTVSSLTAVCFVAIGAIFLTASIFLQHKTRRIVPPALRQRWTVMTFLMYFFLAGYIGYLVLEISPLRFSLQLLTGSVFLAGAFFVFLVGKLTLETLFRINATNELLSLSNTELQEEVTARQEAEEKLCRINAELDRRVGERTAALARSNALLETEIIERKKDQRALEVSHAELDQIFNISADGIRIVDRNFTIVRANTPFFRMSGFTPGEVIGRKCFEVFGGDHCHTGQCPLMKILQGEQYVESEIQKNRKDGTALTCIVTAKPFLGPHGELLGIVEDFKDITERKRAEEEREHLVADLRQAMDEIKTLSGLLPICAHCKKIRDDTGYWNQMEAYISKHSDAQFSHSICEECLEKFYPEMNDSGEEPN